MWGMKGEDLHLKLKPFKEEYDEYDRYDQIVEFFMYIIEHQLDVFAGQKTDDIIHSISI